MSIKWPTIRIDTPEGPKTAIAPWIISASRATDISAYYSEWFFDKLEKGYVQWINPFNRLKPQYVSFANTCAIVFWTKNPAPMIPFLKCLRERGIACYFQSTLNFSDVPAFFHPEQVLVGKQIHFPGGKYPQTHHPAQAALRGRWRGDAHHEDQTKSGE